MLASIVVAITYATILTPYFSLNESRSILSKTIKWARYVDLFSYDSRAKVFKA